MAACLQLLSQFQRGHFSANKNKDGVQFFGFQNAREGI